MTDWYRRLIHATCLILSMIAASAPIVASDAAMVEVVASERPAAWAVPLVKPGLPNIHRLTDKLYRGAQPTAAGMKQLEAMGIKTVLSFRAFHDDDEELAGTGLASERISFKTWHPERHEVVRFLEIVTDPAKQPVFVHCLHGADRTGMMCAIYRITQQGWPKDEAVREMVEGGYGFHSVWTNLIAFVRELDTEALKRAQPAATAAEAVGAAGAAEP
ncbi:MAG: tyrosine-protein phosphatase [Planctomycetes bacterium]|nr:tyrosine-protein phosphatase [Planctomycetota bacterium]